MDEILYSVFDTQRSVILLVGLYLFVVSEFGYRMGLKLFRARDEARRSQVGGIQASVLGLLALLLGFTFAIASERFDTRRQQMLEESNAIGTAYLRTSLLESAAAGKARAALKEYVDLRIRMFDPGQGDREQADAQTLCAKVEAELWEIGVASARQTPGPVVMSFVTSVNDLIDNDAARVHANRSHVPGVVWMLLIAVAGFGCYTSGYGSGSTGSRSSFPNVLLPILITVVITLIADIDRARGGFITVNQQSLIELQASLAAADS